MTFTVAEKKLGVSARRTRTCLPPAALATSKTNHDLRHLGNSVEALHHALTNGFQFAFLISALIAAAGAAVALFGLPKVQVRRSVQDAEAQPERARADEREPIATGG